ncbi:MAG: hypothetical protein H7Z12_04655 [Rhodospirillaceae bacterium]|nr:hypothetical protein [Rhodospirillales bacterium]
MQITWNNDRAAPSFDIVAPRFVESARRLVVDVISRLKAATAMDPMQSMVELTVEQENELEMLACWN